MCPYNYVAKIFDVEEVLRRRLCRIYLIWMYESLYFLQQFGGRHLHAVEGEPFLAEVFDAGTEVIDYLVDAKEAVVRAVEGDNIYRRILSIVLLNIQLQLCGWFLGIDGSHHFVCSFG